MMEALPPVSRCDVDLCFFNRGLQCHAPAITVGSDEPCCETFACGEGHIGRQGGGMVGACHMTDCRFNSEMLCSATSIVVGNHNNHADCDTYAPQG
jgi:hypothetical protein